MTKASYSLHSLLMRTKSFLLVSACLTAIACSPAKSTDSAGKEPPVEPPANTPTYHKDVRPLVEAHCQSCHAEGGIGSFALNDYENIKNASAAVSNAVTDRRMPPWLPSKDCRHYVDERGLTDEQVKVFEDWHKAGSPEGEITDYVGTSTGALAVNLGPPSMVLKAENHYTPDLTKPDDYRCFLLPHTFENETYLLTSKIDPGNAQQVHHFIVYLVEENYVETIEALENKDTETGYECFGNVGTGSPHFISGWAPGNKVQEINPGVAMRLPKGGRLVMQVHYNTLAATPKPDQSAIQLWLTETKPEYLYTVNPFVNFGIDIEPLDGASKHTKIIPNNTDKAWTVVATAPHMHLLGKEMRVSVLYADGREECLVDINRWDFAWQQSYTFLPDEIVTINPGDSVRLECVYDNSAENQPVFNQERQESQRVQRGDGSLDEMCLNYLSMIEPFSELPNNEGICDGFQPCYDQCQSSFIGTITGCTLECAGNSGDSCLQCSATGLITCGVEECPLTTSVFLDCIQNCESEESAPDCVRSQCTNELLLFERCVAPLVTSGQCDIHIAACQVNL